MSQIYIYTYIYTYIYYNYIYIYIYIYNCIHTYRYDNIIYLIPYLRLPSSSFKVDHRGPQDLRRRTEIIPVKDLRTRIKPLTLASGHGRYITVTPERTLLSGGEWPLHIAVINL
jgi:hypothetical protein